MRVMLCEHCLAKVEWSNAALGYLHVNLAEPCVRVSTNPVPQLHAGAGAPDRQSLWEFERAEMLAAFEQRLERLHTMYSAEVDELLSALITVSNVYGNPTELNECIDHINFLIEAYTT